MSQQRLQRQRSGLELTRFHKRFCYPIYDSWGSRRIWWIISRPSNRPFDSNQRETERESDHWEITLQETISLTALGLVYLLSIDIRRVPKTQYSNTGITETCIYSRILDCHYQTHHLSPGFIHFSFAPPSHSTSFHLSMPRSYRLFHLLILYHKNRRSQMR